MSRDGLAGVYLGDRRVGTLGYRDGNTWFDYTDDDPEHPVLGQASERDPRRRRTASGTVPEWFANLLPEHGSGLRRIVERELGGRRLHDFRVITYLGDDLPGAVRVVSESRPTEFPVRAVGDGGTGAHPVKFSVAGVQPKFSMRWEGKGLVLPATGQGGDWLVKLPDRRFPEVPANEYAMLHWANLAGTVPCDSRLVSGAELSGLPDGLIAPDEAALVVRRFDRHAAGPVHQEDFAQVREVSADAKYDGASYAGLARVVAAVAGADADEYLRRLVAMVVMGNLDAHLKNWTFRYPDASAARLSPAYDLVCVSAYPEYRTDELAFALAGARAARNVTLDHFRRLSSDLGLPEDRVVDEVRGVVERLRESWPEVTRSCPVPEFVADHIEERLRTLPLLTGR